MCAEPGLEFVNSCSFSPQRVNDVAARWFEGDERVKDALKLMTGPILSCVSVLSNTSFQEDQCVIEEVREKWCSFLGKELGKCIS